MPAHPASARKTAVLDAAYQALLRSPAASISALYQQMTRHIDDFKLVPAPSTFHRWMGELPLVFKRESGGITVALRSFVPSPEFNAYALAACAGLPLRLDEDAARRDLWLDARPGALWDSLRWAVHEGKFHYRKSYDHLRWLLIPKAAA